MGATWRDVYADRGRGGGMDLLIILWLLCGFLGCCIMCRKLHGRLLFKEYIDSWIICTCLGLITLLLASLYKEEHDDQAR